MAVSSRNLLNMCCSNEKAARDSLDPSENNLMHLRKEQVAEIVLLELNFRDCGMIMLQPYLFLDVCIAGGLFFVRG